MAVKSSTWSSPNNKISVRIVEMMDGEDGVEFWRENQYFSTVITVNEAEAISNALAYFKNQTII
jgi:hypothetical protein